MEEEVIIKILSLIEDHKKKIKDIEDDIATLQYILDHRNKPIVEV